MSGGIPAGAPRSVMWVVTACATALFVPLIVPLTTGRVFTMDDLALYHVPIRYVYAQALSSGDAVTWTPFLSSGFYLHGEGQAGMFHPLHVLLYSVVPFATAFNLEVMASYVFALIGAALMLRRFGMSPAAAWFGALTFAFSGFNLMHLLHINAVAVGAHLPWLILVVESIIAPSTARRRIVVSAAFAFLLGSAFLLGYPQYVFLCGTAVILFAAWRAASVRSWSGLAWLAAAAVCGGGIGAVQLLPTLDVTSESVRSSVSVTFSMSYSLHPLNLIQFLAPYAFRGRAYVTPGELAIHESAVYDGAFCSLALCWAAMRGRHLRSRPVVAWALVLCGLATILALGRYGGLYSLLASLPVVGWFRAPARFLFLLHFGLSIIAAAVFDDLMTFARQRQPVRSRSVASLVLPALLGATIALAAYVATGRGAVRGAQGIAIVSSTALLMALAARGWQAALVLLPVVVAGDLAYWGYSYVWEGSPMPVREIARMADVPLGQSGDLLYSPEVSNLPVLEGYRVTNAYVALVPERVLDPGDATGQRLAGVVWRRAPGGWQRVEAPMPRVRLVSEARVSADVPRDLRTIDIERAALVGAPLPLPGGPQGATHLVTDRPGQLVTEVWSPRRALLITTERYHTGWRATANSQPLPLVRVNGDFLGCVVDSGQSTVTLTFAPQSLRAGWWISGTTILMIMVFTAGAEALLRRARS